MDTKNVIITGLKRAGTTLTCHLLNKVPDTVALHEPMKVSKFADLANNDEICKFIEGFFQRSRVSILAEGKVLTKHFGGKVPDNTYSGQQGDDGLRKTYGIRRGKIAIGKDISDEFLLCVKHPAAFTALLDSLVNYFPCYAVVRNPLSVLASWNSVKIPASDGRSPAAERLDHALKKELTTTKGKFERQIRLLSWYFEKYLRVLSREAVLRYEDIIETGGRPLCIITPKADTLDEKLESKNKNKLYNFDLMQRVGEKLLNTDGAFWEFYTKENIEMLIN